MPPVGFEPAIPANERPQTHVLDSAATGTGFILYPKYDTATAILLKIQVFCDVHRVDW